MAGPVSANARTPRGAVLIVRHAKAGHRGDWEGPDRLRPLVPRGKDQAEGLVERLMPWRPGRIWSSPYVRCIQTVEPLGAASGHAVEVTDALAEGQSDGALALALDWLASGRDGGAVLCTHGDVVPLLVRGLAGHAGLALPERVEAAKGSVWVLSAAGSAPAQLRYLPPPR